MKESEYNLNWKMIAGVFALMVIVTLATSYYGSTDIGDYTDVAKFFAGKYNANIRGSHSYLYGFMHAPLVWLVNSLIVFKLVSLLVLALIIYSVYVINGKDIKTLWLMLLSPIVWYMAPWANPIQLAGLFLLWAWFFIKKFQEKKEFKHLLLSGVFVGLGWAVWDTILFFGIFLGIIFLYDKKLWNSGLFLIGIGIGLMPRLMLDSVLFGFPFFTILKSSIGTLVNISGGIYSRASGHSLINAISLILALLSIPIYYWTLYKQQYINRYGKTIVFLSLCLLLVLFNLQIRYVMSLVPIMIVLVGKEISLKRYKRQIIISLAIVFVFIIPYVMQIGYGMGKNDSGADIEDFARNGMLLQNDSYCKVLKNDMENIAEKYPDNVFVVGNSPDDYAVIARCYWGDDVKEFVSIQDYELAIGGEKELFSYIMKPTPKIAERRIIWFGGGMERNTFDDEKFAGIEYGIGISEEIGLKGFKLLEKHDMLYLSNKGV